MDYEFYPQALENVIRKVAADFKGDLIVTENGIATADDTRRVAFIEAALAGVQNCIADGIPVKGYFHWSLMDNFEVAEGLCHELWPDRREPRNDGTHPEAQPCGAGRIRITPKATPHNSRLTASTAPAAAARHLRCQNAR